MAIRADPDLSEEEKQAQAKNKMQALYAASGCAKVRGALAQVERALQEGTIALPFGMSSRFLCLPLHDSPFNIDGRRSCLVV